jgi:3-methyladenine DNA glycosylase AlkD
VTGNASSTGGRPPVEAMSATTLATVAAEAEEQLRAVGAPERAVHEKAYLKSDLEHAGASLPAVRALAKRISRDHPGMDASQAFALAEELWGEPVHERRMLAVVLLEQYAKAMTPTDLSRLEPMLRDSRTWAFVDGLAGDVAAQIVLACPDDPVVDVTLRRWGADDDFWIRRSALLAHLLTLGRRGRFHGWVRFCELADAMLEEREFFIRKAIGWVLREAGKRHPELVVEFLGPRVLRASGVTVREAVRYLDPVDRDALLAAYRTR